MSVTSLTSYSSVGDQSPPEPLNYTPGEPIDLDELFGFSAARKRQELLAQVEIPDNRFIPYRVFINNVDDFNSKYIAKHLSDQIMGENKGSEGGEQEQTEEEANEEEEEEGEEEEDDKGDPELKKHKQKKEKVPPELHNYEIIGTVKDSSYKMTEDVIEIIKNYEDRENFLEKLMRCGFIIYDISLDSTQISEASWALQAIVKNLEQMEEESPKGFKKLKDIRCFILISTIMTWALTKPLDPEEPDLPFTEEDFRRRKPHPNYKLHTALEKEVVAAGKKFDHQFKTLVLASGITYGYEEYILHYLFKLAWHNKPSLPVFKPGRNHIPLIHVQDLAMAVQVLMEDFPSKNQYVLAVEPTPTSLKTISQDISKGLGTGEIKMIPKEDAFLIPCVTQQVFDMVTVNLNMEPTILAENPAMKWTSELGFVESVHTVVAEYRKARCLKALKIMIVGPPASGKTTVAKKLANHYRLHYLHVKEVLALAIENMKEKAERLKEKARNEEEEEEKVHEGSEEEEEMEGEEEEEEEVQENPEDIYAFLDELQTNMDENDGRLSDNYVIRLLRERLLSAPCQNQGYVLDGYPKLTSQAQELFEGQRDEEEAIPEEEEGISAMFDHKIMPEFLICLEANDEFLCDKAMRLPIEVINGSHYTEEGMLRRLLDYRVNNTDDETVLNYFDELEVHPIFYCVMEDFSPYLEATVEAIKERIGKPRNYGPTPEEIEQLEKQKEKERKDKEEEELCKRQESERQAHEERMAKMEEWARLMDSLKAEEEEYLALQAQPLRHYLMTYVFPTLTKALIEIAQVRPQDPVDYLAEYLFRENPEGKMFNPEYKAATEVLIQSVQKFQECLAQSPSQPFKDNARQESIS